MAVTKGSRSNVTKIPQTLESAVRTKLLSSGLDAGDADLLGIEPCTDTQAKALGLKFAKCGMKIPYFDRDAHQLDFFRFRYLEDTRTSWERISGARSTRYVQPVKTAPELYLPPIIHWASYLENHENRLVFTEGELKSACATKSGTPTIGLGGVWSFKSTKLRKTLLDAFHGLNLKGRNCCICFDSDAAVNPDIRRAEQAFAKELTALGAVVFIARLPDLSEEGKTGIDDYILALGAEAFKDVLSEAEPFALCERMHELNEEVIVVENPGFVWRMRDNLAMGVQAFTGLQYANWRFMDYSDPGKPKLRSAASAWLEWPARATVRGVVYAPGSPSVTNDQRLNTWLGWGAEAIPGDISPWRDLLDHIFMSKPLEREWFERWCAYPIQHPGTKLQSAAVLWGKMTGSGKSSVGYLLGSVYGSNFVEISDKELDPNSSFNSWANNRQFVLADDITGHSNRKLANKIKTLITRTKFEVNLKFVPQYEIRDCMNYLFTSNDADCFYLDDTDRRYFIHQVRSGKLPVALRDAVLNMRNTHEGRSALLHHLSTLDLGNFDPGAEPFVTEAKLDMIGIVRTKLEYWLDQMLDNPDAYLKLPGDLFTCEELIAMYDPSGSEREISPMTMVKKLQNTKAVPCTPVDFKCTQIRSKSTKKLVRLYALRNLEKWRAGATAEAFREHYDSNRTPVGVIIKKY